MAVAEDQEQRAALQHFFDYLFSRDEGFVCIATMRPPAQRDTFNERYFAWPSKKTEIFDYIERVTNTHNVYFCVNVLSAPKRVKENAIPQNLVWADLDTCPPDKLDIPPQCVIESSYQHWQAIWRLDQKVDPAIASNYSKRIAYAYAGFGADKSGHDLTQLLRVPGTYNFKYQFDDPPSVKLLAAVDDVVSVQFFEGLPEPDPGTGVEPPDVTLPDERKLPTPEMVIYRYQTEMQLRNLATTFARYYGEEPASDWSGALWRLLLLCFEVGMSAEEVFVIAKNSKCNKYERDKRPISHLWREVLKAELERKSIEVLLQDHRYLAIPSLVAASEIDMLPHSIIDDYMDWATEATDAVPDFHEISCAVLLSALMATTLRLKTSRNQDIVPNLWAMILGESTLTRKTTAMDMAMDFVIEIDRDLLLASDASVEGLMSALSTRPKMVSIFYRDEIGGFFDAIQRKEYLAGMHEMMTKLYDVPKYMARKLKKDTYSVSEPIFIFFGGGTPERMYHLIHEDYFSSGFIPRFLVMRGHADSDRIKPTGPPDSTGSNKRLALLQTFQAFHSMYTADTVTVELHDGQKMITTPEISVEFTSEVWDRAAIMERQLLEAAENSPVGEKALPVFSRMFVSLLKLTMLLAAARQEPQHLVVKAELPDLLKAAFYIEKWGIHAVDLIQHSGLSSDETKLMSVYRLIERRPGLNRGQVMYLRRLNAREMDLIESTLVQRLMINVQQNGRAKVYWPVGR